MNSRQTGRIESPTPSKTSNETSRDFGPISGCHARSITAPDEQDRRDAIERKFEKLTEATLDIASELCKQERGTVPDRRKDIVAAVAEEEIVDEDLARRLRAAVGFRDVLAHTYGPIVNDDIVYDALQNDLGRYVEFVDAVDEYLSQYFGD